ncbi:hypothetical protein ES703_96938 [subsurface metagenome]
MNRDGNHMNKLGALETIKELKSLHLSFSDNKNESQLRNGSDLNGMSHCGRRIKR